MDTDGLESWFDLLKFIVNMDLSFKSSYTFQNYKKHCLRIYEQCVRLVYKLLCQSKTMQHLHIYFASTFHYFYFYLKL